MGLAIHTGRLSGSKLGCPKSMAFHLMGIEPEYSQRTLDKFEEGQEHDEVMKEEAQEEFDDFRVPPPSMFILQRGETKLEVVASPDGIRDEAQELVEFKGLAPSLWNTIKTEEDLKEGSGLLRKYYNQVQFYAGHFKLKKIRFRIKNKRNLKVKDILFSANAAEYKRLQNIMLDVKEAVDAGKLPDTSCSAKEMKYCAYSTACRGALAEEVEKTKKQSLTSAALKKLKQTTDSYVAVVKKIEPLENEKAELRAELIGVMKEFGQREVTLDNAVVKYGIRYKNQKDKKVIESLVLQGMIPTTEVPEEYLAVYPKKEEEDFE